MRLSVVHCLGHFSVLVMDICIRDMKIYGSSNGLDAFFAEYSKGLNVLISVVVALYLLIGT
jgi:hypothetical protein